MHTAQRPLHDEIVVGTSAAFTNSLGVSLFSLVPNTNAGYPAVTAGVIGLAFTAAATRSIWTSGTIRIQSPVSETMPADKTSVN